MRIEKNDVNLFALAIVLSLAARSAAMVSPTFSVDDLWYWQSSFNFQTVSIVGFGEGRFSGPFLGWLEDALGIDAPIAFTLSAIAMMGSLAVSAILVCRVWLIDDDIKLSAVAVAIVIAHPYQSDLFTWKLALLNGGFPFVMVLGALVIAPLGAWQFAAAVLLIVVGLGIHQIPLQYASAALVLGVPICMARGNLDWRYWGKMVAALSVGALVYVLLAKLVIAHTTNLGGIGRDKVILLSKPGLVVERVQELLTLAAIKDPIVGWLSRWLFCGLAVVAVAGIAVAARWPWQRITAIGYLLLALPAAFVCAVALTIVPSAWVPAFRNLMSLSLLWGAVGVLAFSGAGRLARPVVGGLIFLVLLGFIGSSNGIISDQQRANRRDVSMITRIATDLEQEPRYPDVSRIIFVGTNNSTLSRLHTAADVSTGWHQYGTTLSVFAVWWPGYLVQLYNEVTGHAFSYAANSEESAYANYYCQTKRWPQRGAIKIIGDFAIICLSPAVKSEPGPFDG